MNLSEKHKGNLLVPAWVQVSMWLVLAALIFVLELPRWLNEETRNLALSGWLSGNSPDYFPFLPFIVLLPILYWGVVFKKRATGSGWLMKWLGETPGEESLKVTCVVSFFVTLIAFGMSYQFGTNFSELPPAYHDEYSYLIQAQTYLQGRWSNPEFALMPELFDQMHVLNEGVFASRYFPAVGVWIAPFLAFGNPWLGHQIAQALCAFLMFWIGRELSNNGTGMLAGLMFAFSPGLVLFSNLLLAHHPTLLGLCLFLWGFLKARRTQSVLMFMMAGIGLSFAMLCRPMTAAGFGLPFGILFFYWWLTGRGVGPRSTFVSRSYRAVALGIPLVIGFLVVFWSNKQITDSYTLTPYQLYLDTYTPRHVYGFNNVIRGEQKLGPKVLEAYDGWAENLTPQLALTNVKTRIASSLRWTLGIIPLTGALVVFLLTPYSGKREWMLIPAAILSLHIAHVPYWFEGIMGWHYVFETAPLWILMLAEATRRLLITWKSSQHFAMCWGWLGILSVSLMVNYITIPPLWAASMDKAIVEIRYPRKLYEEFRQQIEQIREDQRAIVFVIPDPADRSMDYVTNPATLSGDVLVARLKDREQLDEAIHLFPDRLPIIFDAKTRQFSTPDLDY